MKQELAKIEKARQAYDIYKDGKWISISVLMALGAMVVVCVIALLDTGSVANLATSKMLKALGVILLVFLASNCIRMLIARTTYLSLKIEELEAKLK